MRLYEIPLAFRTWEAKVDDADGEVTPELALEFDRLAVALSSKVDAIVALVRENERSADAYRMEARMFLDKARARENLATRLKGYLMHHLRLAGQDRVDGARFGVTICPNALPSITWPAGDEVPPAFRSVVVSLDRTLAQKAYRDGSLPQGFEVTFGFHMRIR